MTGLIEHRKWRLFPVLCAFMYGIFYPENYFCYQSKAEYNRVFCLFLAWMTFIQNYHGQSDVWLCQNCNSILTSKRHASPKTLHNLLAEHPTSAKVWSILIFVCVSLNNILKIWFILALPPDVRGWLRLLLVALPGLFCLPFLKIFKTGNPPL